MIPQISFPGGYGAYYEQVKALHLTKRNVAFILCENNFRASVQT